MIWKQLSKLGVPPKFLSILQQLHDGMQARVLTGNLQAELFQVNVGVKQGCVLAPVLLTPRALRRSDGVPFKYRLDGSLFNIWQLRAHTKMETVQICELQYVDDCGIFAHSSESMQHSLNMTCILYQSFSLQVNIQKTEVMS